MRFTLMLGFCDYRRYVDIAQAAEAAGWTTLVMSDSLFFPKVTESDYPYADTEAIRQYISSSPFIEPFIAMSTMAAVTQTLRFYPSVLKVPVRQPLVLAKLLTSLAVISNNRIALGAGISPWKEDFTYNGVDFDKRGRLMDECIEIIRGCMSGDYFEYHSENYSFGPLKMNPAPTRPIPIYIGGHAKPALRRAAKTGDGWIAANTDYDTLKALVHELNRYRTELGTIQRKDYVIHGLDYSARTLDDFRRLRDLGLTDAGAIPWDMNDPSITLQAQLDAIKRFSEEIIQRMD
ncbi:MAG: TIGR03619 family F420-dependent LLM class oxidoreductase [Proteobacteria bacterium]|nr:TIGR03619 family F420-dependent LLM class oxidoreductase [Pseudomonadota bacterium]HQR03063.1 TIGR03619 family F420-dependent LLM class oxidoreductase [Rhodocyclaceae bacterium]